jgi:hypothetical protein
LTVSSASTGSSSPGFSGCGAFSMVRALSHPISQRVTARAAQFGVAASIVPVLGRRSGFGLASDHARGRRRRGVT